MAALSLATDLGMGQPMEYALRGCILSVRLGDALGLEETALRDVYYQALLRYIGCNAGTDTLAALFGDELALRTDIASVDLGRTTEVLPVVLRHMRQNAEPLSPFGLARLFAESMFSVPGIMRSEFAGHCEVAQRLAARFGFGESMIYALGQLYERWDGRGMPHGLKGEAISPAVLIVELAQDAILFHRMGGIEAAVAVAKDRKGSAYAPHIADCFCQHAPRLMAGLQDEPSWEMVLSIEPGTRVTLSDEQFASACDAFADFADLKSPYFLNHSHGVAHLASSAAKQSGLTDTEAVQLHRAGLLHEIGQVGVSAGIWGKAGSLTEREWERVRLHPYYTERVLSRSPMLTKLGGLAALHHERLDGSGYHRGLKADQLSAPARILAAADVYQALVEDRPHRPAHSAEAAADELIKEVRAGRLNKEAANAVLAAAGHPVHLIRQERVAGLSEREIEVLRLIAHGNTIKQIVRTLIIADKTVDNHIQHIYEKIGVSTRAGATLFAMEQNLLAK